MMRKNLSIVVCFAIPLAVGAGQASPAGAGGTAQTAATTCSSEGAWVSLDFENVPSPRDGASVVWTGSRMIVWGGSTGYIVYDSGGRYDPVIDVWYPISSLNAPTARQYALSVWTGTRMLVWSGYGTSNSTPVNTGALYDPITDSWTSMSVVGAPPGRSGGTSVWTGTEMLVWGGFDGAAALGSGARYDPSTNGWSPMSTVGAPTARYNHSAVWTGSRMIVWGGSGQKDDGAVYDPATDTWAPMTSVDGPQGRVYHHAVWTGSKMIVWGGYTGGGYVNTGGRYDPGSDTWEDVTLTGAPTARYAHSAVWIDDSLVIWGGQQTNGVLTNDGARYDPVADAWSALPTMNAPSARRDAVAEWTGAQILIWSGAPGYVARSDGGRYDVASAAWSSMAGAPVKGFGSVWTGSLTITWSPYSGGFTYDPEFDITTPISSIGAPLIQGDFVTVWTGSKMIVWGEGNEPYPAPGTGGIYDLAADSWTPITTTGAPSSRSGHTAVWTDSRMIIYGGLIPYDPDWSTLNDGAAFDPQTNTWSPISAYALYGRAYHTAVWTGSRMIVWGGLWGDPYWRPTLADGARYDPVTNTWSPMTMTGAPTSRHRHTAVWTGSRMIVWGGSICPAGGDPRCYALSSGAGYNSAGDTWQPVGTTGDPPAMMSGHVAVWTGSRMIVYDPAGFGGQYTPGTDSWIGVASEGAPPGSSSAVWTGYAMGIGASMFFPDVDADTDGDGWTICAGDCNAARPEISPEGVEICNGLDDDCSGASDDGSPFECVDGAPCTFDICGASRGCVNPPAPEGSACSDGDTCTVPDTCASGACNPGPARDSDVDSHVDTLCGGDDCNDSNPTVWRTPAEVAGLEAGAGSTTPLSWEDQNQLAGPGTGYDLFSGTISEAGQIDFSIGSCLMTSGPSFHDESRAGPAPGAAHWYLARGRNVCGAGTWGSAAANAQIGSCP